MDEGNGQIVKLYVYDLSQGMAAMLSQTILGRHLEGVWHTAVVVFDREVFFGGQGIQSCLPGGTELGQPRNIENIGLTFVTYQVFRDYLRGLAESTFRGSNYNLLHHNCNTFSEDLCQFLCGVSIPKYILDLPKEFLSTPLGQRLTPIIESVGNHLLQPHNFSFEPQIIPRGTSPGYQELCTEIDEARVHSQALSENRQNIREKLTKQEHKKKRKKLKEAKSLTSESEYRNSNSTMSEVVNGINEANGNDGATLVSINNIPSEMLPSEKVRAADLREKEEELERKKNRESPIVFEDINASSELDAFVKLVDGNLSKEEESSIEELHQYLIENEGSWALGDNFLTFVGRVLRDKTFSTETRVHLLRALAAAALKDDVILLLHQDRKDHILMNYAQDIDKHPPEVQQAWGIFICNLFENMSSSEWLLYISEWSYGTQQISNIRATTKVAVHCLLAACPTLQDIGSSLMYNLGIKEVKTVIFDDVAVELTMAILQFLNNKPSEEHLYRTLKALTRFMNVSPDVPQFISMIGPNPKNFRATSERVDGLIDQISKKVH